ncbi:MAG: glycosyltransferase family 2 protein [Patescibacteria group bacterium]
MNSSHKPTQKSQTPQDLVTAVVLAFNEQQMIEACLNTLRWTGEVLVIDTGSSDETVKMAESWGARVVSIKSPSFAYLRTEALKYVKTPWVLYIDADERVTPRLAQEILVNIETNSAEALAFNRQNVYFGRVMKGGGWQTDQVTRAFLVEKLKTWQGIIHESPVFAGQQKLLASPLIHLTHRNAIDGLYKTALWTPKEAELLAKSDKTPDVNFGLIVKKMSREFIKRAYLKGGIKDGQTGLIEALIQGINRALVYIQVWERQQIPSIGERYQKKETEIRQDWLNNPL